MLLQKKLKQLLVAMVSPSFPLSPTPLLFSSARVYDAPKQVHCHFFAFFMEEGGGGFLNNDCAPQCDINVAFQSAPTLHA